MMDTVHTSIPQAGGSDRYVIIVPGIEADGPHGLRSDGEFEIYTDVWEEGRQAEYLGKFIFSNGELQRFEGQVLSLAEQAISLCS